MRCDNAFTILELLVVTTVIVVLLALLTPAMEKAIDASERAACGSNLHAQDVANKQYAVDDQFKFYAPPVRFEHWPDGGMVTPAGNHDPAGQVRLFMTDYLRNAEAFYCPSKKSPAFRKDLYWNAENETDDNRFYSTYVGYTYWAGGFTSISDTGQTLKGLLARNLKSDGERVMMSDAITVDTGIDFPNDMTRNHYGPEGIRVTVPDHFRGGTIDVENPPTGGHILINDGSTRWSDFADTSLRLPHPINAGNQRDFYF